MKESARFREFTETTKEKVQKRQAPLLEDSFDDKEISQAQRASLIMEVMTSDLTEGYKQILSKFKIKSADKFISLESYDLEIQEWINKLVVSARFSEKCKDWDENDFAGLESESWNFFDSVARVVNTRIIEDEIKSSLSVNKIEEDEMDRDDRLKLQEETKKKLVEKFGVTIAEADIMVDTVASEIGQREYGLGEVAAAVKKVWQEYKMKDQTSSLVKVAGGRLVQKALDSVQPFLFTNLLPEGGGINMAVFLEMFGLSKLSELVDFKVDVMEGHVIREMERKINTKIIEYMFYSDFETIDEHTLGETINTLTRGTAAATSLLKECTSYAGPALAGIGMSAVFLAKIQPLMGVVGVSSLPVIYVIAKKHAKERRDLYKKQSKKTDAIETRLAGTKNSVEDIMTSPHIEGLARDAQNLMEQQSDLNLQGLVMRRWQNIKEEIPLDVSQLLSLGVGYVAYEQGLIGPGAVISNAQYVTQMQRPVQGMLQTLLDDLTKSVRDVRRMEEVLGKYNDLDRPGGLKEAERIGISERKDNSISLRNLSVRGILENININIASGETVVIRGPSGVGKTTLLRAIAGLYKAKEGAVIIGDHDSRDYQRFGDDSLRSLIAYANQKPNIIPDMTLRENLTMWSKPDATNEEIEKVFSQLGLTGLMNRLQDKTKLSGGELVRFGLARATLRNPKILLLDEPTASLDQDSAKDVKDLIKGLKKRNPEMTIICVSHDRDLSEFGREITLQKNGVEV